MPREILTPPQTGLFGKLPATGDFVARGLPEGFRRNWDAWVTRHLAGRLRDGAEWPAGGLRFRLTSGGRVAAGAVLASRDSAGRAFPLSLVLIADRLPGPEGLEDWCDSAARAGSEAISDGQEPDWLWDRLYRIAATAIRDRDGKAVEPPDERGLRAATQTAPAKATLSLWTASERPIPADPEQPAEALDRLLHLSSG